MGLTLNGEQIEMMRNALIEYQRGMRDQERYHCAGPSSVGIELCRRRAVLESILSEIDDQNRGSKMETMRSVHRLRLAPSFEPDYAA